MKGKVEILLINSAAALPPHPSFRSGGREQFAPLGLYCLAETAPERIAVVDLQYSLPGEEDFAAFAGSEIHTVVVRAGKNHDEAKLKTLLQICRASFNSARVGLAGTINKNFVALGDFYLYGTGLKAILCALRGQKLSGFVDNLQAEMQMPLPIPKKPFAELYDFSSPPEKTIDKRTLEIFQPWLGLHEHSQKIKTYPGLKWLAELGQWLKESGYKEFHFRPSGVRPADIHEIRSVMLNLGVDFALSFANIEANELENNCAGAPLRQIWLYRPEPGDLVQALKCLRIIAEAGCCPALVLGKETATSPELWQILELSNRIALAEVETWNLPELKKLLMKFWGHKNRFFKMLFNIRSAHDLVEFMKVSAFLLEILFSKNQKIR